MLKSSLRSQRRRACTPRTKRPARIPPPPGLADLLARLDGEREGRAGLPDFGAEARRLEDMLAAAGLAIVPMAMNLVDRRPLIVAAQIRAGMALLGWAAQDLAAASDMHEASILTAASAKRRVTGRTLGKIRTALEDAGVSFTSGPEGDVGVVLGPNRPSASGAASLEPEAACQTAVRTEG